MAVPYSWQIESIHEPSSPWRATSASRMAGYQLRPILAAGVPHGLHGVVVAIEVMALAVEIVALRQVAHQVVEPLFDLGPS